MERSCDSSPLVSVPGSGVQVVRELHLGGIFLQHSCLSPGADMGSAQYLHGRVGTGRRPQLR